MILDVDAAQRLSARTKSKILTDEAAKPFIPVRFADHAGGRH